MTIQDTQWDGVASRQPDFYDDAYHITVSYTHLDVYKRQVEQLDRLLPTIQSRCQNIPLRKANVSTCYEYCMKENIDPLDAYLLSHLSGCWEEIVLKLEDENYQQARIMAMDTIQKLHISPDQALVHLQREGFKDKKGSDKLQFMMFLDILSLSLIHI